MRPFTHKDGGFFLPMDWKTRTEYFLFRGIFARVMEPDGNFRLGV